MLECSGTSLVRERVIPWNVLEIFVEYKRVEGASNVQWTSFLSYQADAELERATTQSTKIDISPQASRADKAENLLLTNVSQWPTSQDPDRLAEYEEAKLYTAGSAWG